MKKRTRNFKDLNCTFPLDMQLGIFFQMKCSLTMFFCVCSFRLWFLTWGNNQVTELLLPTSFWRRLVPSSYTLSVTASVTSPADVWGEDKACISYRWHRTLQICPSSDSALSAVVPLVCRPVCLLHVNHGISSGVSHDASRLLIVASPRAMMPLGCQKWHLAAVSHDAYSLSVIVSGVCVSHGVSMSTMVPARVSPVCLCFSRGVSSVSVPARVSLCQLWCRSLCLCASRGLYSHAIVRSGRYLTICVLSAVQLGVYLPKDGCFFILFFRF